MGYMLEIKNIHKTFNKGTINEKKALDGVNLNLNPGDFVTIIGGNGAGKSTTLNAVAGTWLVDEGNIVIDGVDITRLPEHKRAVYLGRVFQDPMTGTASTMSIEENMAIAARRGQRRGLRWGISRKEREEFKKKLGALGLGLKTAKKVLEISDKIIEENQLTAMMVTHNMKDAIAHGNRLIMMHEGRIIYDVSGEEKRQLHVSDLLKKFEEVSGGELDNDRMMLG